MWMQSGRVVEYTPSIHLEATSGRVVEYTPSIHVDATSGRMDATIHVVEW